MLITDYLVIGAGAASMAFVDTLLTESPNDISVVIVDRHAQPGGHWNDAYGFVRLHQPSLLYGVASEKLEGNWLSLLLCRWMLPWKHRASKAEILSYYENVMAKWVASGKVQYFPESSYHFEKDSNKGSVHKFTQENTGRIHHVRVREKLVNGVVGECRVPSKTPPTFPIQENVQVLTPNEIYRLPGKNQPFWPFSNRSKCVPEQYVVLGAGKTAMDTVVYLQRDLGVAPENITWVVPNDVWMLRRDGSGSPWSWAQALLANGMDGERAALDLEKKGVFARLDKNVTPTKFRFPLVGDDELAYIQKVKQIIRRGRVASIRSTDDSNINNALSIEFDKGEPFLVSSKHIFVHCTSPGPFNGYDSVTPFASETDINLEFLYAPPVPISMSCIAVLESQRRKGKIDVEFGRQLLGRSNMTANEVLQNLIRCYILKNTSDLPTSGSLDDIQPLVTLAAFICLFESDPTVGYKWLQMNRLSFFSIPGFKGEVYENVCKILENKKALHLKEQDVAILLGLLDKLKSLQGK